MCVGSSCLFEIDFYAAYCYRCVFFFWIRWMEDGGSQPQAFPPPVGEEEMEWRCLFFHLHGCNIHTQKCACAWQMPKCKCQGMKAMPCVSSLLASSGKKVKLSERERERRRLEFMPCQLLPTKATKATLLKTERKKMGQKGKSQRPSHCLPLLPCLGGGRDAALFSSKETVSDPTRKGGRPVFPVSAPKMPQWAGEAMPFPKCPFRDREGE